MSVQSFDSWDEMQRVMAEAEDAANDRILPTQADLRDDVSHTRYWVQPYAPMDCLIFGETPSLEDLCAQEAAYYDMDDPEDKDEYDMSVREFGPRRARGYLTGTAYSTLEPDGEGGDTHVSQVVPISKEAFEEGRRAGWRMVQMDGLLTVTLDPDQVASLSQQGKITPTLVTEWNAFRDSLEA